MKKRLLILIMIMTSISCSKDKAPIVEVNIEMTKSNNFQEAEIKVNHFSLYDKIGEQASTSIIQKWDGIQYEQDLTSTQKNTILIMPHWELELKAVKPDIEIDILQKGISKSVEIEYKEYLELDSKIILEENKIYDILFVFDTDKAFVNMGPDTIKLNWNFITVSAVEK